MNIFSPAYRSPALLILGLLLLLTACSGGSSSPDTAPAASARLVKPADNTALLKQLKAELVKRYKRQETRYAFMSLKNGGAPVSADAAQPTAAAAQAGSSAPLPHSETTVQEKGVDEGDLVKTDGAFIYLARGSRFLVIAARPPEQAAVLSDLDLQEQIGELYLENGRVTIITHRASYTPTGPVLMADGSRYPPVTRLYRYDVSIPAKPQLTGRYEFPGTLQGSRRINTTTYLVTNHLIDLPDPVSPWDYLPTGGYDLSAFEQASAKATAENLKRIDALTLEDLLPSYSRIDYTGGAAGPQQILPAVAGTDIAYPEGGNGTDMSLVIALDTSDAAPAVTSSAVLSSWCRIYMSADSLYLTSGNDWLWIEPVMGANISPDNPEPSTAIHKFSVANGVGKPVYRGSGLVSGWLNDQFSLGEYNGYLRVGTTRGGWWGEGISNQLAVFTEKSGNLVETGSISGIAPRERIYAMRYDQEKGYMVTFRRTDPLYTFDLSDPYNPRKAGEIKVNGFATYMQLMGPGNSRLLTVGQSADDSGRVTGNKLQLFDVSSLASPKLLGDFELGSGWSQALYDYHAFLYYEPLGLLTIPYYDYSSTANYTSALRVFEIAADGIKQRGSIAAAPVSSGYGSYADTVDRAVIIGTDIYAFAHRSMISADAGSLLIKNRLNLPEGYGYYTPMQPAVAN